MAQGSTPPDHCNLISQAYRTLWKDLDISYDKFIRTTDSKHQAIVKEFYSRVLANGDIYRADYEGIYCVSCEEYKVIALRLTVFIFLILLSFFKFLILVSYFYFKNVLLFDSFYFFNFVVFLLVSS
ncbi:amp-CoA ligase, variant 3 [Lathyrus oleraceus]|nr:amp-CoA ligase, variant 3 [Pisum sativum]